MKQPLRLINDVTFPAHGGPTPGMVILRAGRIVYQIPSQPGDRPGTIRISTDPEGHLCQTIIPENLVSKTKEK